MRASHSRKPGTLNLFWAASLVFILLGCGAPAASEPDNFRGVKWGAEISSILNLSQIAGEGDLIFYEKSDDRLQMEEIKLEQVKYGFHKGRFYMGMAYFPAATFNRIQEIVTRQLGQPAKPDKTASKFLWDGPDVSVLLTLGDNSSTGRLVYMYKPIQLEVEIKNK